MTFTTPREVKTFTKVPDAAISFGSIDGAKIMHVEALLTPKALALYKQNKQYLFKGEELEAVAGDLNDGTRKGYKKKTVCRVSLVTLHEAAIKSSH